MSNALAVIETITAVEFFKPGASASILETLETEARAKASMLDVSKDDDRESMRSLAFKLGKAKNRLDDAGKGLVAEDTARIKRINAERGVVWDRVEGLQKEVRQPLTDWENAEKNRVALHESALAGIPENPAWGPQESVEDIERRLSYLQTQFESRDWEEFKHRAKQAIEAEIVRTQGILSAAQKREAEVAELASLRAEQAAREQKEREERIAAEARQKAEQVAEVERKQIEQEKFQAEARAKESEARERAAAERAELDRLAAVEAEKQRAAQAEADRIATEERHAREKAAAIEAERARQEAETLRLKEESEARERNKQHAAKINREVRDALMAYVSEVQATAIVKALASGIVPHCKVAY